MELIIGLILLACCIWPVFYIRSSGWPCSVCGKPRPFMETPWYDKRGMVGMCCIDKPWHEQKNLGPEACSSSYWKDPSSE